MLLMLKGKMDKNTWNEAATQKVVSGKWRVKEKRLEVTTLFIAGDECLEETNMYLMVLLSVNKDISKLKHIKIYVWLIASKDILDCTV